MGIGNRAATCASCGKRLTRKSWYYRNGQYFCKARCWEAFREKAAADAQAKAAEAAAAKEKDATADVGTARPTEKPPAAAGDPTPESPVSPPEDQPAA